MKTRVFAREKKDFQNIFARKIFTDFIHSFIYCFFRFSFLVSLLTYFSQKARKKTDFAKNY